MNTLNDNKVDLLSTRDVNLHGRKFTGAADASNLQEFVTLSQLAKAIEKTRERIPNVGLQFATYSELLGRLIVRATQSQLSGLFNSTQALVVWVTDFAHLLYWNGTAYSWGPGEDGRHDIVSMPIDPSPLTGWQLCDGTTVSYLKSDGTTANFTTPDLTSAANKAAYAKLGTPVGINAAVAPTSALVTNSGTAVIGTDSGAGVLVTTSGALSVSNHTHTHTDSGHAHTIAATAADGEPRNYILRPFFRR